MTDNKLENTALPLDDSDLEGVAGGAGQDSGRTCCTCGKFMASRDELIKVPGNAGIYKLLCPYCGEVLGISAPPQ